MWSRSNLQRVSNQTNVWSLRSSETCRKVSLIWEPVKQQLIRLLCDHQLWPYSQCHQSHYHWYCHDYVTMLIMVWFRHRWRKIKWALAFDDFYCHPHLHQHVIMIRTKTKHNLVKLQVLFRPTSLRLTSQSTPTWWRFPLDSISRFSLMIVI